MMYDRIYHDDVVVKAIDVKVTFIESQLTKSIFLQSKPNYSPDQERKAAENLVKQAKNTFTSTANYKEMFVSTPCYYSKS